LQVLVILVGWLVFWWFTAGWWLVFYRLRQGRSAAGLQKAGFLEVPDLRAADPGGVSLVELLGLQICNHDFGLQKTFCSTFQGQSHNVADLWSFSPEDPT
jgi:hypothetical protein